MSRSGRLVILDRDGVINVDSDNYVKSAAEWVPIDGSIDAIARLSNSGFDIAVATNQSGLGRGLFERKALYAMHRKLRRLVTAAGGTLQMIAYCPHHPDDGCVCRKPAAGLLDVISKRLSRSLVGAIVVGDSLRDLEAGAARGCELWLVRTGKGLKSLDDARRDPPSWWSAVNIADDLAMVADQLTGANS